MVIQYLMWDVVGGSLALYIAKKYTNCRVTGICNSTTQKAYIDEKCWYAVWYPFVCFKALCMPVIWLTKKLLDRWQLNYVKLIFSFCCSLVRDLQLQNLNITVPDISTFEMEASITEYFPEKCLRLELVNK